MEVGLEHAPRPRGLIGDGQELGVVADLDLADIDAGAVTSSVVNGASQVCAAASVGQNAGASARASVPAAKHCWLPAPLPQRRAAPWGWRGRVNRIVRWRLRMCFAMAGFPPCLRPSALGQGSVLRSDRLQQSPNGRQIVRFFAAGPRTLLRPCHRMARQSSDRRGNSRARRHRTSRSPNGDCPALVMARDSMTTSPKAPLTHDHNLRLLDCTAPSGSCRRPGCAVSERP